MSVSTFDTLEAADAHVLGRTRTELGTEVGLIDLALTTLMHGLGLLADRGKWRNNEQILRVALLVRCFNTAYSGHQLLCLGYFAQPLALLRSAFEDWIAENYVRAKPHDASRWMDPNLHRPTRGKQIEAVPKEKRPELKTVLGTLDEFAHPGRLGVWQIAEERETGAYLRLGGHYDAAWFNRVAYPFLYLLSLAVASAARLMTDIGIEMESEWVGKANELDARGTEWVRQYNGEYSGLMPAVHDEKDIGETFAALEPAMFEMQREAIL